MTEYIFVQDMSITKIDEPTKVYTKGSTIMLDEKTAKVYLQLGCITKYEIKKDVKPSKKDIQTKLNELHINYDKSMSVEELKSLLPEE